MPTVQVPPEASELLQEIANSVFKSKKTIVVTGAGISTNSGIPVGSPSLRPCLFPSTLADFFSRIFARRMDYTR